jgi:hypothetical protein
MRHRRLRQAIATYRQFHSTAPARVRMARCRRMVPDVLVQLGTLRGLIYSADRTGCGQPQTYIHFMDAPPLLACDPRGTQLFILGGRYRITTRGIEG